MHHTHTHSHMHINTCTAHTFTYAHKHKYAYSIYSDTRAELETHGQVKTQRERDKHRRTLGEHDGGHRRKLNVCTKSPQHIVDRLNL